MLQPRLVAKNWIQFSNWRTTTTGDFSCPSPMFPRNWLALNTSRLWFFQWSCMDVRVGLWGKLSAKKLMLLNCGVGEDSWESLGLQGDQPVHPRGDQSWVFIGRTDAEAETPVFWPPHVKSWLNDKDPDAGRTWGQEEKAGGEGDDRRQEEKEKDDMAGWHHWLDGHEFE